MSRVKRDCRCKRVHHAHGTERAYTSDRCRCLPCALARHHYLVALHAGEPVEFQTVPITASRLRLRALTWMGWSPPEIAPRLETSAEIVQRWRSGSTGPRYGPAARVLLHTHEAISALYDELWNVPSNGPHALRMHNLAKRKGWLPPLALDDDMIDTPPYMGVVYKDTEIMHDRMDKTQVPYFIDEIAVQEAVSGRCVDLTRAERSEAIRRLTTMGYSSAEIAERLHVTSRTVTRRRAA